MSASERLRRAREAAHYPSAAAAAAAMGANRYTYTQHENGLRGVSRDALRRYAAFFRVSLEWLMTGRGDMKTARDSVSLPVDGVVGAGAAVEMADDLSTAGDVIDLPLDGTIGALRVRGDSQWPRFLNGEIVLYDRRAVIPDTLVGRTAIVQLADGRRLIKTLRRGQGDNRWTLESHNAPPERNVELIGAWRYIGTIAV